MQITDVIADMLTRIRNANSSKHATVDIPASGVKKAIAEILKAEALKESEILKAEGEAEYMKILSEAYADEGKTDFYSFVRSLDALKASVTGDNKTVILSEDSPIAQIFNGQ